MTDDLEESDMAQGQGCCERKSPARAGQGVSTKRNRQVGTNQTPHRVLFCRAACLNWDGAATSSRRMKFLDPNLDPIGTAGNVLWESANRSNRSCREARGDKERDRLSRAGVYCLFVSAKNLFLADRRCKTHLGLNDNFRNNRVQPAVCHSTHARRR